ncbi:caspase recruitment domain-containing protein 19 isoform X2 [Pseudopipra pipra]
MVFRAQTISKLPLARRSSGCRGWPGAVPDLWPCSLPPRLLSLPKQPVTSAQPGGEEEEDRPARDGCRARHNPRNRWMMLYRRYQSYCHRLQHDMYFLTSTSRLNEQVVDKIILQLNRVYPQILTNEEAEKFRNPKASLHTRLSDLLKHLQKKGDRHCQEFYRALQINAEQLFNDLPSRKILSPVFFLACFSVAAGLALFWYCCNSDTKVIGRARRILGFSPIIIRRHVRNICMLYLEDISRE